MDAALVFFIIILIIMTAWMMSKKQGANFRSKGIRGHYLNLGNVNIDQHRHRISKGKTSAKDQDSALGRQTIERDSASRHSPDRYSGNIKGHHSERNHDNSLDTNSQTGMLGKHHVDRNHNASLDNDSHTGLSDGHHIERDYHAGSDNDSHIGTSSGHLAEK